MNDVEHIIDFEKAVAYFGEWPDFNDCSLVSAHFENRSITSLSGSRVELKIDTPQNWLCNGYRIPAAAVRLILDGTIQCEVSGFSHQNHIDELRIRRFRDPDGITRWGITMTSENGLNLEVVCEMVVVESIVGLSP